MIFNTNTMALLTIASVGVATQQVRAAPAPVSIVEERGFGDAVSNGWHQFTNGVKDGFNAEQKMDLAPEEGHKRGFGDAVSNGWHQFTNGVKDGFNAEQKMDLAPEEGHKRGFGDAVSNGWHQFTNGVKDGFNAEQKMDLAPEEHSRKRTIERYMSMPAQVTPVSMYARSNALADFGNGLGKTFGDLKDDVSDGYDKLADGADQIFHAPHVEDDKPKDAPPPPPEDKPKRRDWEGDVGNAIGKGAKYLSTHPPGGRIDFDNLQSDKRDSWEDNVGNAVGAGAGWVNDHLDRVSFKRDSWEDNVGNAVGAGAGWVNDHIGRVDPTDLIPAKGAKKALKGRSLYFRQDQDLLA